MHRSFTALALACACAGASAQFSIVNPDLKEIDPPPPPALRTQGLIGLDIPGSSLRFGVDPASITVGSDAVVRYVVVATSSTGTTNAIYEGIRCSTSEVKVYARHNPDTGWAWAKNPEWVSLQSTPNYRYSLYVARNGACVGEGPNGTATHIVRDLRAPPSDKFHRSAVR